ncbi:hypothetical protein GCQ56_14490 [Marinifilum sp. N1E240]|uniref:hypothetical protein n=1 Tax=Marinifilum sp. N1E240 TaxID=2608082 RepID=UPI00128C4F03|nr:hypothetical protein [Marinifilum sp. N1E240]MPQ48209.1 hypothetical protein [Marinifilum sp. N1E240]
MQKFLSLLLKIKNLYLIIALLLFGIFSDFVMYDFIDTKQVNERYNTKMQTQQEAEVYNEHDDLMADFKDDLAEIALEEVKDEDAKSEYLSDALYFFADSVTSIIIYCLLLALFIYLTFRLTSSYSQIKYGIILKVTLIAYFIIPLKNVAASIWFGLIQTDYDLESLEKFYMYINPSIQSFLTTPEKYNWYNSFFSFIDIQLLLMLGLIPLFIKISEKLAFKALTKMTLIPILFSLIIWPYVRDIIFAINLNIPVIDLSF